MKKCICLVFYSSQPSCDIVLNRLWHQNSDPCLNRHNTVQMQWLWLCCYFQLETINNLETRSGKYIWQFSNNKSTCLTFINHKTINKLLSSFLCLSVFGIVSRQPISENPKIIVTKLGTSDIVIPLSICQSVPLPVWCISPIFFEVRIPNLMCGYILEWRRVAYHFRVTVTMTSDLVFRIIVSSAYLLYYLRWESQIWYVNASWDGGESGTIFGSLLPWPWPLS